MDNKLELGDFPNKCCNYGTPNGDDNWSICALKDEHTGNHTTYFDTNAPNRYVEGKDPRRWEPEAIYSQLPLGQA